MGPEECPWRGNHGAKNRAALANTDGGEFIVGIEDRNSGLTGLDRWAGFETQEDATYVLEALARDIQPPIPFSIEWLQIAGDKARGIACAVTVQKSEDVHRTSDGTVWTRRGASTVRLAGSEVTDLTLSKGARSYEDQLLGDYGLADLVVEAELSFFLRSYSPATSAEDLAIKQRLIDRDTTFATVSSAILYAENPSASVPKRCGVKVARYETKDVEGGRDQLFGTPISIEGPARQVIDQTLLEVARMIEGVSAMRPDGTMGPLRYPPRSVEGNRCQCGYTSRLQRIGRYPGVRI